MSSMREKGGKAKGVQHKCKHLKFNDLFSDNVGVISLQNGN